MNGILVIDKPKDYTSFDVIAKLRKKLGQKKIGHMGTLDPMATGVLPILLGETAKFQIFSPENEKKYIAKMQFGITTDTLDITGNITSKNTFSVSKNDIESAVKKFIGEISQMPPMFSAIKQSGKKLYDLARQGIEVERKPRNIKIKNIKIIDFDEKIGTLKIQVECSKGTYIRSLCDDIGKTLGCGATMTSLQRISSNGFEISQSVDLNKFIEAPIEKITSNYLLPTEYLFKNEKSICISVPQATRFRNGGNLMLERIKTDSQFKENEIYKVICGEKFIGLGKADLEKNELKILKCLHEADK